MRVIKSEWHQVEKRYSIELDIDIISDIFPNNTDEQNQEILNKLSSGEMTWEEFEEIAENENDDGFHQHFDWEWLDEDDWWTDRTGGYDITYEVEND